MLLAAVKLPETDIDDHDPLNEIISTPRLSETGWSLDIIKKSTGDFYVPQVP